VDKEAEMLITLLSLLLYSTIRLVLPLLVLLGLAEWFRRDADLRGL
jgi:hypothetical protein